MLPPSKANGGDFKKGANMAITGATTMDFEFFQRHGLGNRIWNNGPLGTQIQWFQQLTPSICGSGQYLPFFVTFDLKFQLFEEEFLRSTMQTARAI
jgi:hypothetical protein